MLWILSRIWIKDINICRNESVETECPLQWSTEPAIMWENNLALAKTLYDAVLGSLLSELQIPAKAQKKVELSS